jgi:hypothetical protein
MLAGSERPALWDALAFAGDERAASWNVLVIIVDAPLPASTTFLVSPEGRVFAVVSEGRVFIVGVYDRIGDVAAGQRTRTVDTQTREFAA